MQAQHRQKAFARRNWNTVKKPTPVLGYAGKILAKVKQCRILKVHLSILIFATLNQQVNAEKPEKQPEN